MSLTSNPSGIANRGCTVSFVTGLRDRKSTRLNSSHLVISYAVFCLKKKNMRQHHYDLPRVRPVYRDLHHTVAPLDPTDTTVATLRFTPVLSNHDYRLHHMPCTISRA